METPHEFYLETNGKIIDIDGSYGGQCWDLFSYFSQKYCGVIFPCQWTGYVADLWYHFYDLHLNVYYEQITDRHALQDGDWLIWDKSTNPLCWISDSSHIAMFRCYNQDNPEQNIILTQNPGGNPNYTHQMVCDFLGFVGALRPKCYIDQTPLQITEFDIIPNVEEKSVKLDYKVENGIPDYAKYILNGEEFDLPIDGIIKDLELDKEYNIELELRKQGNNVWTTSEKKEFILKSQETPQNQEKDQNNINIPPNTEKPQNEPKNDENDPYAIELINQDKKNPLVEFIKWIIGIIQKLMKGEHHD